MTEQTLCAGRTGLLVARRRDSVVEGENFAATAKLKF